MLEKIKRAREIIKESDAVLITAGAGMGVDSGLPDFRGNEGFWRAYPPIKKLGLSFSEMASPHWFKTDPKLAWAFYGHRLHLYRDTTPHDGFKMLLDLVNDKNENYFIYTSNVDGQFQKAGFSEEKIVEVHGSIHFLQCSKDCQDRIWSADDLEIRVDMDRFEALDIPTCPNCESVVRPNILMFGDWYWNSRRTDVQNSLYRKWLKGTKKSLQKIAIIEIGAGTAIPTIRNLGNSLSSTYKQAYLIRINPRESEVENENSIGLELGGLEGLKAILE
ncbi:Sir2 family NAD-dependent protein deacetylase [Hydrogenimonas thermophila]|uniref:SIR2 family NAD-dependent protein deacylase n=1 Tax=Hydrogenimonas thermophila TaxID=223786 RepID=UPI002937298A|nr:Sir2 family NAD-dependent protein deacetylase [Hydrogenimonas thermophila]WOE71065.1 Sir2 family NAD-dependent protein deacetylase [Hydrogenimonas thermophila]WOE73583.1 Sir2 family NAD-dependent protein deacetylase [Hydrogenimonas thermophila]